MSTRPTTSNGQLFRRCLLAFHSTKCYDTDGYGWKEEEMTRQMISADCKKIAYSQKTRKRNGWSFDMHPCGIYG